jgi:hypothetical protein
MKGVTRRESSAVVAGRGENLAQVKIVFFLTYHTAGVITWV